jgi:hypothetical protein
MPMRRNTMNAGGGASVIAGQTSNLARCAISSTGLLWQQGVAGFAMQGINEWSVINTNAGVRKLLRHSGHYVQRLPILCTLVRLANDKWGMSVAPIAE